MKPFLKVGFIALIFFVQTTLAQTQNTFTYNYKVDLTAIANDQIHVELTLDQAPGKLAIFSFPKIVPGIYGAMDFGQYISNVQAYSANGNKLKLRN